jgi:hypothetical protein
MFVQGYILAQNREKCYPEWVVFFIYRNMALMQSPSNTPDAIAQKTEFSPDAQNRINTVAKSAIAVLDKNLDAQNAIRGLFGKMIAENLRDPVSV